MYEVIKFFTDLQDDEHAYNPGDEFPRKGLKVSKKRLEELSGSKNRQKTPLIKFVEEKADGKNADSSVQGTE